MLPILKFIDLFIFEIRGHKCRFRGPVSWRPAFPWQPFGASLVAGSFSCYPQTTNLIGPSSTLVIAILTEYVT